MSVRMRLSLRRHLHPDRRARPLIRICGHFQACPLPRRFLGPCPTTRAWSFDDLEWPFQGLRDACQSSRDGPVEAIQPSIAMTRSAKTCRLPTQEAPSPFLAAFRRRGSREGNTGWQHRRAFHVDNVRRQMTICNRSSIAAWPTQTFIHRLHQTGRKTEPDDDPAGAWHASGPRHCPEVEAGSGALRVRTTTKVPCLHDASGCRGRSCRSVAPKCRAKSRHRSRRRQCGIEGVCVVVEAVAASFGPISHLVGVLQAPLCVRYPRDHHLSGPAQARSHSGQPRRKSLALNSRDRTPWAAKPSRHSLKLVFLGNVSACGLIPSTEAQTAREESRPWSFGFLRRRPQRRLPARHLVTSHLEG